MNYQDRRKMEWHAEYMTRLQSWSVAQRDDFEERAAIMEYEAGMDRIDAESRAFLLVLAKNSRLAN